MHGWADSCPANSAGTGLQRPGWRAEELVPGCWWLLMFWMVMRRVKKIVAWVLAVIVLVLLASGAWWLLSLAT